MMWPEPQPVGSAELTQRNISGEHINARWSLGGSFLWKIWHRKGSPSWATPSRQR